MRSSAFNAKLTHDGRVRPVKNANDLAFCAPLPAHVRNMGQRAVAMHALFRFLGGQENIARYAFENLVGDQKPIAVAVQRELPGHKFGILSDRNEVVGSRLYNFTPRGEAFERCIQLFAVVPRRPEFLDELLIAGAAVRQLCNVREQGCVVDVAGHKRIIESGDCRESDGSGSSQ